MFNISDFLSRFAKLGYGEQAVIGEVKNAVEEVLHFALDDKAIRFSSGVVYLTVPATLKNEIFLHKKELLEKINQKNQQQKILDIR